MAVYRKYSVKQLLEMLDEALHKERKLWRPLEFKNTDNISAEERDEIVWRMYVLHEKMGLCPETYCLAVNIFDRFLSIVKVQLKHLQVIGAACSLMAAKILEEEENIPGTLEIVRMSGCGCSVAEVVRMERLILDKLGWDLRATTPHDFLHVLLSLLIAHKPDLFGGPKMAAYFLSDLTRQLQLCLCCHDILEYRPATLALSLLSLQLEKSVAEWFFLTEGLQHAVGASDQELMTCRERLLYLHDLAVQAQQAKAPASHNQKNAPVRPALQPSQIAPVKPGKRKVQDEDEDEVFEAIKRLYSEEEIIPRRESTRTGHSVGCRPKLRESHSVPAAMQTVAN